MYARLSDDYTRENVLNSLKAVKVFLRHAIQHCIGVVESRTDECTRDSLRHVFCDGGSDVAQRPNVVERRFGNRLHVIIQCELIDGSDAEYLDVPFQIDSRSSDVHCFDIGVGHEIAEGCQSIWHPICLD